jgi:hypothetical protein
MSTFPFRTDHRGLPEGQPKLPQQRPACVVCGLALKAKRTEARYCSGRCRVAASRHRRRDELRVRIRLAQDALKHAAKVLGDLEILVESRSEGIIRGP